MITLGVLIIIWMVISIIIAIKNNFDLTYVSIFFSLGFNISIFVFSITIFLLILKFLP